MLVEKGLQPNHHILDIGCGCGRIARPLASYLSSGRYDGLDIAYSPINWCLSAFRDYPHFHFHHSDIASAPYNATGVVSAANYGFPFPDRVFDFVFLGSVFTHMLPEGLANYLREIARVLRPAGKCFATFFLLDDEALTNVAAKRTTPDFAHPLYSAPCRVEVPHIPEAAIAYDEDFVKTLYRESGLTILELAHGSWGRGQFLPHCQDAIWAGKLDRIA